MANFKVLISHPLRFASSKTLRDGPTGVPETVSKSWMAEQVSVVECMGCQGNSVVIEADAIGEQGLQGVLWWPTEHLADLEPGVGVPPDLIDAYSEGVRCVGVQAPNAAAAMFRTTIAKIVQNKGSEAAKKANTLNLAIKQMVADRALFEDFGDWADHVRITGNAGAHGEKFDPVDIEQATELQMFIRELINFLYIQPARLANARQPTKQAAGTAPTSATGTARSPGGQQ